VRMYIIVLAGMPASGKSTAAAAISEVFGLPVIAKDRLKEVLFDVIGFENYAQKRLHDHAANALVISVTESMIRSGTPVILDNNFDKPSAEALDRLCRSTGCPVVTLMFGGDPDAFYRRYVERDRLRLRHLGHKLQDHYPPHEGDDLDYDMTRDEFEEKFVKRGMMDFRCTGARIEIDATCPEKIDMPALIEQIRALIPHE